MTARSWRLVSIGLVLLLALSMGAAGAADDAVTMIVTRDPISFDPHGTLDPGAPVILAYVYDTLVYQDENGAILPSLAESWSVEDEGYTLTFNLRDDVVFSNGAPLNADAVIYTFERVQRIGQRSFIYDDVTKITEFERVDDYTVRFHMSEPSATLLSAITYSYAGILEPGATEAAGEDYGQQPVGTGPFMLSAWTPQSSLTLVPNPLYNGHRPWVDTDAPPSFSTLNIRFTVDQSARANALLAGEADIAYLTSPAQMLRFVGDPNYTIMDSPGRSMVYLGFNTARAPFDNADMRRALAQAVNKDDVLLIAASDGMGEIMNTPLPPTLFGYNPALEDAALTYDAEAARAALVDAGFTSDNPLKLTILTSTFPSFQVISTVLQAQFAEIGVEAEVEVLDYSAVREMATAGDYDLLVTRYDWNDPDVLRMYLGTENIGSTNRYFYSNPELDRLTLEGQRTFDPAERLTYYNAAQEIVMQDMPWVPLYMPVTKIIVSNRVQNVDVLYSHVILDTATVE